jgi:DNA-binding XRE family transcriptional regulator
VSGRMWSGVGNGLAGIISPLWINHISDKMSNFNVCLEFMTGRDLSLLAAQIRAARGLLGWSQAYLAEAANIHRATLVDLEAGKREPQEATLEVLMSELAAAGIVFTDTGVRFRKWPPKAYVPTGIKHRR